jgi:hypothetical protein
VAGERQHGQDEDDQVKIHVGQPRSRLMVGCETL